MTEKNEKTLFLNRGSDIHEALLFRSRVPNVDPPEGTPIDMTGFAIEVFEAEDWFDANGSVEWTDQAAGEALLDAPWAGTPPPETWVRLRVKRTADDFDDAFPKIVVRFL